VYDHTPFFYSDFFDFGYEAVGHVDSRLEMVTDWEVPYREGVIYYLRDGRVRGVLLWNIWGQADAARVCLFSLLLSPVGRPPVNAPGRVSSLPLTRSELSKSPCWRAWTLWSPTRDCSTT
jgi:hypothetical protein